LNHSLETREERELRLFIKLGSHADHTFLGFREGQPHERVEIHSALPQGAAQCDQRVEHPLVVIP